MATQSTTEQRLIIRNLSPSPGKNRRHAIVRPFVRGGGRGGPRLALTPEAEGWMQEIMLRVRAERNRQVLPPWQTGLYWISVLVHAYSMRQDADAALPLVLDGVQAGLGINDGNVAVAPPIKHLVSRSDQRRVDLYICIRAVSSAEEWQALTDGVAARIEEALGWTAISSRS